MTRNRSRSSARPRDGGQILVLFALGLVAFVAGVALVIDAGNAYAQQRGVQNGSDAAANADGTPNLAATCPIGSSTYIGVGCLAVVTFAGTYQPITPIIGGILFKNGVTFTAKTVLPVEYSCPNSTHTAAQCPRQP